MAIICKTKTKEETAKTKNKNKETTKTQNITACCVYKHVQVFGGAKKKMLLSWNMDTYFQWVNSCAFDALFF